ASGAQPLAAPWIASLIVIGTPPATVVEVPKLDLISVRTTPLWVRMSGPFEPSPGKGPAVSSGMTSQFAAEAALVDDDAAELDGTTELRRAPWAQPTIVNRPAAR